MTKVVKYFIGERSFSKYIYNVMFFFITHILHMSQGSYLLSVLLSEKNDQTFT